MDISVTKAYVEINDFFESNTNFSFIELHNLANLILNIARDQMLILVFAFALP